MESIAFGVSSLSLHFMVIIEGSVHTWGLNNKGQLGDGTTINRNKPIKIQNLENVVSVAWGERHSMAMTQDGDVYLWGCNEHGELGDGTAENSTTPKILNTLDNIKMIACSNDHNSMLITNDGDVYCWGKNDIGQLGDGSTNQSTTPKKINNLSDVETISCGDQYSIAINEKGDVYSWGLNSFGQLGNGSTTNSTVPQKIDNITNVTSIACSLQHALALMSCGDVYSWGHNDVGQLGNGNTNNSSTPQKIPNLDNIVAISCGYYHSMALTRDGDVYSWGYNNCGQLGIGSTTKSSTPLMVNIKDKVCTIACVGYNSMVLTTNGNIFIWGNNGQGQLCNGTTTKSTTPQKLDLPFGTLQWSIPLLQNIVIYEQHIHMVKLSNLCSFDQNTIHDTYLHKVICEDERQFNIHKAIIRIRSPKLENFEKLSISSNLFEHIVYFIYTNKTSKIFYNTIVPNDMVQLINICKMIELKELVDICQQKLVNSFTKENIFNIATECCSLNLIEELDWIIWFICKNKLSPTPDTIMKLSTNPNIISKLFSQVMAPTIPPPPEFKTKKFNITLKNDMKILFSDKIYSDFTIIFKNTQIKVHKFILSRWPYFTTNIITQHSTTTIHKSDMPLNTFLKLIQYFYFGIESLLLEDCYWILSLENFYQLQGEKTLLKYCRKTVDFGLKSNWKESVKLAIETDNEEMEKKAISLIPNSVDPQQLISFSLSFAKKHQQALYNQQSTNEDQLRIIKEQQRTNKKQLKTNEELIKTIEELQRTNEVQKRANDEQKRIIDDVMKRLVKIESSILLDH